MTAQAVAKTVSAVVPLPTDGQLALAVLDAEYLAHDADLAVRCRDWGGHVQYVASARKHLADMARRLGYELVPAQEKIDA